VWRVQPRRKSPEFGMASQVVEKVNLQRLLVVGQFATGEVLVGQPLLAVRVSSTDIAPDSQECLSYSAN